MKVKNGKNFIALGGWFRLRYAYLDTKEYRADSLFCRHRIPVKYGDEYSKKDEPYVIIFCTVRKAHKERFEKALEELIPKMELFGHNDYEEYCSNLIAQMMES